MRTIRSKLVTAALPALLAPTLAHAADFEFTIPLDFTKIHERVSTVRVECVVTVGNPDQVYQPRVIQVSDPPGTCEMRLVDTRHPSLIGRAARNLEVRNGTAQGNRLIDFDALPGKRAVDAEQFRCLAHLVVPEGRAFPSVNSEGLCRADSRQPLVLEHRGRLPD